MNSRVGRLGGHSHDSRNLTFLFRSREATTHRVYLNEVDTPLPAYAPELNPVEYIWAYWKQHELPNVCPKDYWELDERARKTLRRMRRKPRLITAFWKQSSLCLD